MERNPGQDIKRGRRLQTLSYVLGGLCILFFLAVGPTAKDEGGMFSVVFGVVLIGTGLAAYMIYDRGEQHLQQTADEKMATDPRAPILYLRSFENDEDVSSYEQTLAAILEEVGPFVAIGRPGDKLPPLGASRRYIAGDDWQSHVIDLMNRSAAVILVAGKTEGLAWEMSQCLQRLDPRYLLVLVPSDEETYEAFRSSVERDGLGLRLPDFPSRKEARYEAGSFSGLLRFDSNWAGRFEFFEKALWVGNRHEIATKVTSAEDRLRIALSKVEFPDGSTIKAPGRNWLRIGLLSYLGFALLFGIVLIGYLAATGQLK